MKNCQLHLIATGVMLSLAAGVIRLAAAEPGSQEFPYALQFELGDAEFIPGDQIAIQTVRGTAPDLRTGETYCVEGTYTLSSQEEAKLALFVTTRQDIRTKTDPRQIIDIKKGSGSFRLVEKMSNEGCPHISFYPLPSGSAFGGVYFGEGEWLLRKKGWSYLDKRASGHDSIGGGSGTAVGLPALSGPNRALFEYLGNPVEIPETLDPAYTAAGLKEGVQSVAAQAGVSVRKIEVEDSEYPFLVGILCEESAYPKFKAQLQKSERYAYQGSVGSHTAYAMNIVPRRTWPAELEQRINRRSMLRMQAFYDRFTANEPGR